MTWAFRSARKYGLQTCASFESTSKAFRTRKGIAERVRWEPYVDRLPAIADKTRGEYA